MAGISADLKTYIVSSTSCNAVLSGRVHQNSAPQETSRPFIWYQRRSENESLTLDGAGGLRQVQFDVECITGDPLTSESLSDKVKTRLNGKRGTFGNSSAKGVFVTDHDDDYIPKGAGLDSGLHVASFNVTVWYTT